MTDIDIQAIRERVERLRADSPHLDAFGSHVIRDRADLLAVLDEAVGAFVDIEGSGPCYCPRDINGARLGCKCPVCVARVFLTKIGASHD